MASNPVLELQTFGQSVWLHSVSRPLVSSGELKRLIDEDGLRGMTSNPALFEKAIDGNAYYDEDIRRISQRGNTLEEIYEALVVDDVDRTADLFRPVYERTDGRDGFVSLETSPHLAYDAEGVIIQARRLWKAVGRPNVMIKVPATRPGLTAIRVLTCEGINTNITLLFSLTRYREVADAYLAGLEAKTTTGKPLTGIASVASFFVSRIDTVADQRLEKIAGAVGPERHIARALVGETAIASAKLAYQVYKEVFYGERFNRLLGRGARRQRLLWGSTGTKDPAYSNIKYVEALIGPNTINTMPPQTLKAYRDHGRPAARLEWGLEQARQTLRALAGIGIDLNQVTEQLEQEGVKRFIAPYDKTLAHLDKKRSTRLRPAA